MTPDWAPFPRFSMVSTAVKMNSAVRSQVLDESGDEVDFHHSMTFVVATTVLKKRAILQIGSNTAVVTSTLTECRSRW
jgi:hypothetical protein